jgi:hypothetical protein
MNFYVHELPFKRTNVNSNADYDQDDTQRAIEVKIQQLE